jgi:hypothetical protein
LRALILISVVAIAGCVTTIEKTYDPPLPPGDDGAGSAPLNCVYDTDCAPAAVACCDCPTFAVNRNDPAVRACAGVMCPPAQQECRQAANAICTADGVCKLACAATACTQTTCADGYALDDNGCLSCDCAMADPNGCRLDAECVRTRADCCGCKQGGVDTAVRASDQMAYDASLDCPPAPACPGIDVCTADEPQCVQGRCELLPLGLPPNACGRADLPPCPPGQVCTVNLSDPANMQGVGVCAPP